MDSLNDIIEKSFPLLKKYFSAKDAMEKFIKLSLSDAVQLSDPCDRIDMMIFVEDHMKNVKYRYEREELLKDLHNSQKLDLQEAVKYLDEKQINVNFSGAHLKAIDLQYLNYLKKFKYIKILHLQFNNFGTEPKTNEIILNVIRLNPNTIFNFIGNDLFDYDKNKLLFENLNEEDYKHIIFIDNLSDMHPKLKEYEHVIENTHKLFNKINCLKPPYFEKVMEKMNKDN